MKRRDFLLNSATAGIAGAGFLSSYNPSELFAGQDNPYLVAVKGGEPDIMFDKAIEAMGGMKNFVKKGQKVVVKPNIGWDVEPERAGNTNPLLVKRIIEQCFSAGAKEVYVFDNPCDNMQKCYSRSGIEKAVKDAGGKMAPGKGESYYHPITIKGTKKIKDAKVHELILNADVFINVPVLKHHSSAKITVSMKNLMGIVWDRGFWHRTDLHQCIAEFASWKKPQLNIVDAYRIMKKNGPRGVSKDDVLLSKSLLMSTDMVAIDAAAAKLFGSEPGDIPYIKIAHDIKVGRMDLENLNIKRIKI